MFPYIEIPHFHIDLHTGGMLIIISILLSLCGLLVSLRDDLKTITVIGIISGVFVSSFVGARLFHVIVEKPQFFWKNPQEIWSSFYGMTFYGALISGAIFLYFFNKLFINDNAKRNKIWDIGTICLSFTYGVMRIGCLASGCCWGKITALPWSVQYFNTKSVMPYLGIPVHPVQLYDAFIGFLLAGILYYLYNNSNLLKGKLIYIFCILYPTGRFITEEFRGDNFRGVDILFGLSTSQLISVALLLYGLFSLLHLSQRKSVNLFFYKGNNI